MANTPKTPQQMYDDITEQAATAAGIGRAMEKAVQRKVEECNALGRSEAEGSTFLWLEFHKHDGEPNSGQWSFSVTGKLQYAVVEVNPKPGRIGVTMLADGNPKGPSQLIKTEKAASDLPEYLAASVIESVLYGNEFKA